ncbi:MAG: M24 family metallopeptidase, partial [Acidimicrobiales bacterium]
MTERDVTRWAMKAYRSEGADRFFHLPVALFGPRTTLPDPWDTPAFWPTDRVAEVGDAVILDASPILDGYVVDTAISICIGDGHAHPDRGNRTDRGRIPPAEAGVASVAEQFGSPDTL